MNSFRYLRDPLFLWASLLYVANRWGIKPHVHTGFFHDHFNDLLLMPCALPPLLWIQRRLGLRQREGPPTWAEIALYFIVWSILFEGIGPHLIRRATADPYDIVAYAVGGLLAGMWWHRGRLARPNSA